MKISSLLHRSNPELDYKKRALQRKEVGEVYKKNAKYADPSKNPLLQALEDLLSGKTEKEIHEADTAARKESQLFEVIEQPEKNDIEQLKQVETGQPFELLEKVRQAALAPAQPSLQDIHVTESTSVQVRSILADEVQEINEEIAPFVQEDFTFEIPERFQKDFERNPQQQTIFSQDLELLLSQRTFYVATETYSTHISMVNNGYRPIYEPKLSITA